MREKDYFKILDYYSSEYYFTYSQMDDSEIAEWKNREIAAKYMENYWLSEEEYQGVWKPAQVELYDPLALSYPDLLFRRDFNIFPFDGGLTLNQRSLEKVKSLVKASSEDNFVLIQNSIVSENPGFEPTLRIKYPLSVSWEDLMSGGYISTVLYEMPHNDYFVFGNSGLWAGYVSNDYENPVLLLAIDDSLIGHVTDMLANPEDDAEELKKVIPNNYKAAYRMHF